MNKKAELIKNLVGLVIGAGVTTVVSGGVSLIPITGGLVKRGLASIGGMAISCYFSDIISGHAVASIDKATDQIMAMTKNFKESVANADISDKVEKEVE